MVRRFDQKTWFTLLMFLSGAAGLIYQIVWVRELGLIFGNTVWAVSTAVSGFLAGLALGSAWIGKRVDSYDKPLHLYRNIEIGIGLSAVLVTVLMRLFDTTLTGLADIDSLTSSGFVILRFVVLLLLLIVPTFLMGGTLPALARAIGPDHSAMGGTVARLYAANTYGGLGGAFLSGFLFIPFMGVTATLALAVSLNLCCAFLSLRAASLTPQDASPSRAEKKKIKAALHRNKQSKPTPESVSPAPTEKISVSTILFFFFVVGFCTLAYEVLWTRAFVVSFKSTVYLFSNLLAVFLLGMAVGSHFVSRFIDRLSSPLGAFGLAQIGVGLFGFLSVLALMVTPDLSLAIAHVVGGMSFGRDVAISLLLMCFVFLTPALLMGAGYPLVCKIITRRVDEVGACFGGAYAIGTVGSIVGSVVAGFLLLPGVGLQWGLFIVSAISLLVGYTALLKSRMTGRLFWAMPVSGMATILIAGGVVVSGADIGLGARVDDTILYSHEGVMGTVRVTQEGDSGPATLMVNNYQLAISGDVAVRFGHLPLLLLPDAKEALLISLGSGITAGSLSRYDLSRIDVVEIVPSLRAVQPFFEQYNHNIIDDPRCHLTFWDGRHYVRAAKRKWDLVVADLFQPDSAGVGSLYTREHFTAVRERLRRGGAMAQWLPLYQLSPESLKIILKTFASVFPRVQLWFGDINSELPTVMLIGSEEPLMIHPGKLYKRLSDERSKADMIERNDPLSFLSFYITDEQGIKNLIQDAPINSDDQPRIEYLAPRRLWERRENGVANFATMVSLRQPVTSLVMGATQDEELTRALDRYFEGRSLLLKGKVEHANRNYAKELKVYQAATRFIPHDPFLALALFDVGYLYYGRRDYVSAARLFEWSAKVNPDLIESRFYLAKAYQFSGKKNKADEVIRALVRSHPQIARSLFGGS